MTVREEFRYTKEHEWLAPDGTVGITDYAQDALGDVVFVELPAVGRVLTAGEAFGVVESVKSVSDLYSPVAGTVAAVNESLRERPELINQDPYGEGWIIRLDGAAGGQDLLDAAAYRALVGQ
jgi:glycine cleavage system H protein